MRPKSQVQLVFYSFKKTLIDHALIIDITNSVAKVSSKTYRKELKSNTPKEDNCFQPKFISVSCCL